MCVHLIGDIPQGHFMHPDTYMQQEADLMSREQSYSRCNSVGSINTPTTSNHNTGNLH